MRSSARRSVSTKWPRSHAVQLALGVMRCRYSSGFKSATKRCISTCEPLRLLAMISLAVSTVVLLGKFHGKSAGLLPQVRRGVFGEFLAALLATEEIPLAVVIVVGRVL